MGITSNNNKITFEMVVKKEEDVGGKLAGGWMEDAKEVLGTRNFAFRDGIGEGKGTSGNETVG
jgi:hypothetical protein